MSCCSIRTYSNILRIPKNVLRIPEMLHLQEPFRSTQAAPSKKSLLVGGPLE